MTYQLLPKYTNSEALVRLVYALSPRRPQFHPGPVYVGFVMDKVTTGQTILRARRCSPISIIPPVLKIPVIHQPLMQHNLTN